MKQILISLLVVLIFLGCTGKKQVNPIPSDDKKIIPERELILTNNVNKAYIEDFDSYANAKLKREKGVEIEKNLWDIGLERGHK
jgi:hypothetical protein